MTTDNQKDARYERFGSDFEPTLVKPDEIGLHIFNCTYDYTTECKDCTLTEKGE